MFELRVVAIQPSTMPVCRDPSFLYVFDRHYLLSPVLLLVIYRRRELSAACTSPPPFCAYGRHY